MTALRLRSPVARAHREQLLPPPASGDGMVFGLSREGPPFRMRTHLPAPGLRESHPRGRSRGHFRSGALRILSICSRRSSLVRGILIRRMGVPERLARASSRHPRRVFLAWLGAIVVALALAVLLLPGNLTTTGHVTGNPESKQAEDLFYRLPYDKNSVDELIVVRSPTLFLSY